MQITTGFLTGNLFSDETGADVDASVRRYAELCEAAIMARYPDANLSIDWEDASGSVPYGLQTRVALAPGEDADADAIAETVDYLCGRVWEDGDWIVENDGDDTDDDE